MGRSSLPPRLEAVDGQQSAALFADLLHGTGLACIHVNRGLPHPGLSPGPGGITHVPFITCSGVGCQDCRIRDGGRIHTATLGPGDCIVHAPGSYVRIGHRSAGRFLRCTLDTDHSLVGQNHCLDPDRPGDPASFPPLQACILPGRLDEPAPALVALLLASPPTAHAQRRAWLQALLWQLHDRLLEGGEQGEDRRWLALRAWLREHACSDQGRDHAAAAVGVHPQHLSRICQQHGTSFSQLRLDHRLQRACSMLSDPSLRIQDIAPSCGFSDTAYFIRRFRAQHGCTPGEWRQSRRLETD
ncbi:MAG: helix-turn-helix transcriptional regulator [Planctomycetota bacterium]